MSRIPTLAHILFHFAWIPCHLGALRCAHTLVHRVFTRTLRPIRLSLTPRPFHQPYCQFSLAIRVPGLPNPLLPVSSGSWGCLDLFPGRLSRTHAYFAPIRKINSIQLTWRHRITPTPLSPFQHQFTGPRPLLLPVHMQNVCFPSIMRVSMLHFCVHVLCVDFHLQFKPLWQHSNPIPIPN